MRRRNLTYIKAVSERIVEEIHPQKIILFGSYAYGRPNYDSDVDILVISPSSERPVKRRQKLEHLFSHRSLPMDLLWITPREIRHRLAGFDPFLAEILEKGKVLYAKK